MMKTMQAFGVDQTHGMLAQCGNTVIARSDDLGWTSLYASAQIERPFEASFSAVDDLLVVMHRDGPANIDGSTGDHRFSHSVPAGGLHIIPGGSDFDINLGEELQTLHVYIRRDVLVEVAAHMVLGDPETVRVNPTVVEQDRELAGLMESVFLSLRHSDPGTALYIDFLSQAIAAHIIRSYSGSTVRRIDAVQKSGKWSPIVDTAVDYMRKHIDQPLRLTEISKAVNCSASHLAREFRLSTGMPPHQFLIRLRVENARQLLAESHISVAEVAFECGFSHQEHMTRHFRNHCGTTPAAFRRARGGRRYI